MDPVIIYIMGVSGSGKTTIGKLLSAKTALPFFDGDDFHNTANKEKMKAGLPLNDDDRAAWLASLNQLAKEQMKKKGAIIACSALKEKYRKVLSDKITVPVYWVFLHGSYELLLARMQLRKEHFMPAALLPSQLKDLQIPAQCIAIDVSATPGEIVETIISQIKE
jgi:carbohydrate kinase (thermoresistant glucokinase family)